MTVRLVIEPDEPVMVTVPTLVVAADQFSATSGAGPAVAVKVATVLGAVPPLQGAAATVAFACALNPELLPARSKASSL